MVSYYIVDMYGRSARARAACDACTPPVPRGVRAYGVDADWNATAAHYGRPREIPDGSQRPVTNGVPLQERQLRLAAALPAREYTCLIHRCWNALLRLQG